MSQYVATNPLVNYRFGTVTDQDAVYICEMAVCSLPDQSVLDALGCANQAFNAWTWQALAALPGQVWLIGLGLAMMVGASIIVLWGASLLLAFSGFVQLLWGSLARLIGSSASRRN